VELGSQFFWPFAVMSEPRPYTCGKGKGVTREYPGAELGAPRMGVSATCGSETDFTSVLALASSATGKSPKVARELCKHLKCQILFLFSPGMYLNALNASLLALPLPEGCRVCHPAAVCSQPPSRPCRGLPAPRCSLLGQLLPRRCGLRSLRPKHCAGGGFETGTPRSSLLSDALT